MSHPAHVVSAGEHVARLIEVVDPRAAGRFKFRAVLAHQAQAAGVVATGRERRDFDAELPHTFHGGRQAGDGAGSQQLLVDPRDGDGFAEVDHGLRELRQLARGVLIASPRGGGGDGKLRLRGGVALRRAGDVAT